MANPVPTYYNDPNSFSNVNEFYVGPNSGEYSRFSATDRGAGTQNLQYPAWTFDQAVASQFTPLLDLTQYGLPAGVDATNFGGGTGGFADLASGIYTQNNPELAAAIEYNNQVTKNKERFKNFFT